MRQLVALVFAGLVGLAATIVAVPERASAGVCGRRRLSVEILAGAGSTFSRGIVVALDVRGALGTASSDDGDASSFRIGARLERGEEEIALRVRSLAPGLALLVPASRPRGRWTLHTRLARAGVVGRTGAALAAAGAPVITRLEYVPPPPPLPADTSRALSGSSGAWSPPPQPIVLAELSTPASGVLALIAYAVRGTEERALTWEPVAEGARQVQFTAHPEGRCSPGMRFRAPPRPGLSVRFAWVDADGRVSARSDAMTVPTGG